MFCGSLPQTHICAGKAVQSNTCSGTISSLIVMSLDCQAVIMCLMSVLRAEVS